MLLARAKQLLTPGILFQALPWLLHRATSTMCRLHRCADPDKTTVSIKGSDLVCAACTVACGQGDQYDVREKEGGRDVRNLGRPVELAARYFDEGADEVNGVGFEG